MEITYICRKFNTTEVGIDFYAIFGTN